MTLNGDVMCILNIRSSLIFSILSNISLITISSSLPPPLSWPDQPIRFCTLYPALKTVLSPAPHSDPIMSDAQFQLAAAARFPVETEFVAPRRHVFSPISPSSSSPASSADQATTMSEIPSQMKALVANQSILTRIFNMARKTTSANAAVLQTVPVPQIESDQVLVKVTAVAINPTDWKHADILSPKGSVLGCDYAGVVVKVGENATAAWKEGDRIASSVHGGLYPDRGSFAEYLKVDSDLAWKIPENFTDEAAASIGISAGTSMLGLNDNLEVPWLCGEPGGRTDTPVLIYAASTSTGLLAIQFAKLAGVKVVATCSPHSFDLVKKYGADDVFDYRSPNAVDSIKKAYPNLDRAFDCFSEGNSSDFCAKALGPSGGKVVTLLPDTKTAVPNVTLVPILMYTILGKAFQWLPPVGPKFPAKPEDRAAGVRFYAGMSEFASKLQAPPLEEVSGGLEGINAGMDWLRKGKVSGKKIVAKLGSSA